MVPAVPQLVTRLIGSYERELHDVLEELFEVPPPPAQVVNVGAGEGYYVVGAAMRIPSARILGFESDSRLRRSCRRLADANGVSSRVEIRGTCDLESLAALAVAPDALLISDCEGAETDLIDPEEVEWLANVDCLIEVHDAGSRGAARSLLTHRLRSSHDLSWIDTVPRYASDYGSAFRDAKLTSDEGSFLISEGRRLSSGWIRRAQATAIPGPYVGG